MKNNQTPEMAPRPAGSLGQARAAYEEDMARLMKIEGQRAEIWTRVCELRRISGADLDLQRSNELRQCEQNVSMLDSQVYGLRLEASASERSFRAAEWELSQAKAREARLQNEAGQYEQAIRAIAKMAEDIRELAQPFAHAVSQNQADAYEGARILGLSTKSMVASLEELETIREKLIGIGE